MNISVDLNILHFLSQLSGNSVTFELNLDESLFVLEWKPKADRGDE